MEEYGYIKQSEKVKKIDQLFSNLDEFDRIRVLSYLTRLRDKLPSDYRTKHNPDTYYATIPTPETAGDYGFGFVNISLKVIPWKTEDQENVYKTTFQLTNIDDGGWEAHSSPKKYEKCKSQFDKALDVLQKYENDGSWFTFEELKNDFESCGLYLKKY